MPTANRQSGFTYLTVLYIIAFMGVGLALIGEVWHTAQMREREQELLFAGHQFRKAILLYYESTPGAPKRYPRTLEELLKDDRFPSARRYLRRLYHDPITGKNEWGIVKAPDGGVMGVYSLSEEKPLKSANFRQRDKEFEGTARYADWKFVYLPAVQPTPKPGAKPAPAAPASPTGSPMTPLAPTAPAAPTSPFGTTTTQPAAPAAPGAPTAPATR